MFPLACTMGRNPEELFVPFFAFGSVSISYLLMPFWATSGILFSEADYDLGSVKPSVLLARV